MVQIMVGRGEAYGAVKHWLGHLFLLPPPTTTTTTTTSVEEPLAEIISPLYPHTPFSSAGKFIAVAGHVIDTHQKC